MESITIDRLAEKSPPPGVRASSPEKRKWIEDEAEKLRRKNLLVRERAKTSLSNERSNRFRQLTSTRENKIREWEQKTKNSPFSVNLLAENERIYEENEIREKQTNNQKKMIEKRREVAMNNIILKALSEFSDLDALRQEKRAIMVEEQRLKALLALEKTTNNNKADRIVAERALKQRQEEKTAQRRNLYRDSLDQMLSEESMALRMKHGLSTSDSDFRVIATAKSNKGLGTTF
mmetsp:Transcript_24409/g.22181  ORF Transcript_24409/g.22181 Transcript_24409/m.22181 type:complete len:234 (-) Transcript_24409:96-797(-)|eukprot:CAMPEP_0196763856 /NCGR_PEP_ID=MMETSP1095-20130614/4876_1 /TAXON_ID=96789 ORGANISM="Chromulina nebulosa, Strain UTEXLB2642" /NCGR_SAMPLE_ID=MMETSP1095 /ASSEMBLY_ACC=CAM_ASM_000446 /LENGTH=233 /DNA_ID=CAMNT_0042117957 /DNA_START=1 /DNA_END=702 /DNA_ORIENTATION=-